MSELHIALVAEGKTDYELIQAALKAILPRAFVMTLLQPEATEPRMGTGWGGVLKWCYAAAQRHQGALENDPILSRFDFIILHLDVDVAMKRYADCGSAAEQLALERGWKPLPCAEPCPPVTDTVVKLKDVLSSWLGEVSLGGRTVLCLPAQSSGSWLAAALLPEGDRRLHSLECNVTLENSLSQLPKKERVKKSARDYLHHAVKMTAQWENVKRLCHQAERFEQSLLTVLNRFE